MTGGKFLPLLLLMAGLTACGGQSEPKPRADEIRLNSTFQADFELVDHNGQPVSDESFEGKPMLIYLGFTACPEVCPAALGKMTAALDKLGEKDAAHIQPLFISVDPRRDTPELLKDHLAYDPRILGLTGTPEQVEATKDALNFYAVEIPLPDSALGYTVQHQQLFFITDAAGTPQIAVPDSVSAEHIAAILQRFIED